MKKVFAVLGVIFVVLLVVGGGVFAYFDYTGNQLDASSKHYVDVNLPKIVSTWSEPALWTRASPELRHAMPQSRWRALFRQFKGLGPLVHYDGCKGQSDTSLTSQHGKVVLANYTAHARFQNAPAAIRVRLIRHHGTWQILGLYVDSPYFGK